MSDIATMSIATMATAAQAAGSQGPNAVSALVAFALTDSSAQVQSAATEHPASGVAATGIDPSTPFPVSDVTAISDASTLPAAAVGHGMIDMAPRSSGGATWVSTEGTGHQLMAAAIHSGENFAVDSSASGGSTPGNATFGEMLDIDGGGHAHWTMHMTTAASATLPGPWACAESYAGWWDSGHNLAETLTLQFAADVTNPSTKDAHVFTVL